ncbi:TPA: HEXXH motif-containing putative peptide modification protein [Vibrio vulnificus]
MEITTANWVKPSAERADWIIKCNLEELAESLIYIHGFFDVKESDLKEVLGRKQVSFRQNMPQAFLYHEYMIRNIENEHWKPEHLFTHLLSELSPVNENKIEIVLYGHRYHQFTNEVLENLIADDHLECYGEHLKKRNQGITVPSESQFRYTQAEVEKCLNYIECSCPELYDEIKTVVSQIHIMSSPCVNAGSYLSMLGMFNIRYLDKSSEHWSRLAEHIIHESAHNLLYQLWHHDPIITDDDGLFYTPFRKDERPISGVFHAMFVLARTIYGFNQLLKNPDVHLETHQISSHYNEANNELPFTDKFYQTVEVLEKSGKLTEFGNRIMKDCVVLVEECKYKV